MKRLKELVVLFLVVSTFLVCCDKEDEPAQAAIEGKWQYAKEGTTVAGQEVLEDYIHTLGCNKDFTEFKTGGVLTDNYFEKPENTCVEYSDPGTWFRNGNQLTINLDNEGNRTFEILELTNSTLKIKADFGSFIMVFTRI